MKPEIPKSVAMVLAALYVAGLWMSQMHLGRYGITGFSFSDTRYFLTGLWLFLSLLPTFSYIGVIEIILPKDEALLTRTRAASLIVAPMAFWLALLTTMQLSSQNDPITVELSKFVDDFVRTTKDTALWFLAPWLFDAIIIFVSRCWGSKWVCHLRGKLPMTHLTKSRVNLFRLRSRRQPFLIAWLIFCGILHSFSYLTWLHEDIKQAYGGGASFYGCIHRDKKPITLVSVVYESDSKVYYVGTYHPDPFRKLNAAEICGEAQAEDGTILVPDVVYTANANDLVCRSTSSPND